MATQADILAAAVARISQGRNLPYVALLTMIAPLAKAAKAIDEARLDRLLTRKAGDFLALRARLAAPLPPAAVAGLRAEAAAALEAGRFSEVDRILAQAEMQLLAGLSDIARMPLESRVATGEIRADRGATSLLTLSADGYREAAARLGEASALVGLADPVRSHALALAQADALVRLTDDLSDPSGLESAIAHLRVVLAGQDNFDETVLWAATQERLGMALSRQAKGLAEAASCYRTALEDLRQAQDPALWIRLQRRLGTAAQTLDEQAGSDDTDLIDEAIVALRAALAGTPRAEDAQGWARLHHDLGRALYALGRRTGAMAELEAAFNSFQAAAGVWTRERAPELWAGLHHGMGLVLSAMGERYSESIVLEEAVSNFGMALEHRPRDGALPAWSASMAEQGLALVKLALRRRDMTGAQQALSQIMAALQAAQQAGLGALAAELQKTLAGAGARVEAASKAAPAPRRGEI